MRYATPLICLIVMSWPGMPSALAQDENAPPVIESIEWFRYQDYDGLPGGATGSAQSFSPGTDTAYEADEIYFLITITDADWSYDDQETDEGVYIRMESMWIPFENYLVPEPPPIGSASEDWSPAEEGFGPNTVLNGRPALLLEMGMWVPTFEGKSQARLRELTVPTSDWAYGLRDVVDWDVRWALMFQVTNDTGDDSIIVQRTQFLYAIEHPAAGPSNPGPFADAGSDQSVVVGTTVTLDASRTFDAYNAGFDPGLPDVIEKDNLSFTWEWISGPAYIEPVQSSVGDPTATVRLSVASDATPGTLIPYVFRVLAHDNVNSLPTTDTVQILVFTEMPPQ